jgi:hypothetical protein
LETIFGKKGVEKQGWKSKDKGKGNKNKENNEQEFKDTEEGIGMEVVDGEMEGFFFAQCM